jgi:hypothetical protein
MVTIAPSIANMLSSDGMATFVGLFRHLDLPEHEALARCEGRNHMDRRIRAFLLVRPARRLAIDGDDIGRHTGQRRQSRKATLELLSVERRQNIAEMIVRRRSVAEWPPRHVPGLGLPRPESAGALFIRNRRHLPIAPPYVARLCGSIFLGSRGW